MTIAMDDELMMNVAADLLSEDGENPEYDRAIVELTTRLLGRSHDEHDEILAALRGSTVNTATRTSPPPTATRRNP